MCRLLCDSCCFVVVDHEKRTKSTIIQALCYNYILRRGYRQQTTLTSRWRPSSSKENKLCSALHFPSNICIDRYARQTIFVWDCRPFMLKKPGKVPKTAMGAGEGLCAPYSNPEHNQPAEYVFITSNTTAPILRT